MPSPLRIIFLGTPDFAVPSLDILVKNNYHIVGVITAPDKPSGRGQKLSESPVKLYAVSKGLKVLQPDKLKEEKFLKELESLKPDLQVVVAFRMLPETVWKLPRLGTFNLHASLLPQYRGAAPINWAIINGEQETGITTFFLKHEIDTGDVVFQEKIPISNEENAGSLHDKLMMRGAALVLKTVQAVETGNIQLISQEVSGTRSKKTAPKIYKENCRIRWDEEAPALFNLIRGLSPYPAAWTQLVSPDGKKADVKIFSAAISEKKFPEKSSGAIITDGKNYLEAVCGNGIISVKELQVAGKNRAMIKEFLNGFRLDEKWKFI